jgi:hypothetical protein
MKSSLSEAFALRKRIQRLILLFIIGLALSGITAFPIAWELKVAHGWIQLWGWTNEFTQWIERCYQAVLITDEEYPFLAYGTDWLAFAHLVIAVAFIGPLRDPVKNKWVIEFGLVACIAIFPLAFIAGAVREIPLYWRFIDCSFGVLGGLLLWVCYVNIRKLEKLTVKEL